VAHRPAHWSGGGEPGAEPCYGRLTPDSRSEETINHLEHLHRSGYNGWTTSFDKQVVPPLLAVMREQGTLDRDLVCGYMLAHGHSAESIKNLAAMMARL
jgi:hypothetical protein